MNHQGTKTAIDWSDLTELYCEKQLNTYQIAELKGCHNSAVSYALRKEGIPVRTFSEANRLAYKNGRRLSGAVVRYGSPQRHTTAVIERISHLYQDSKLSMSQISEELGISSGSIGKLMRRNGIVTRSRKEAFQLAVSKGRWRRGRHPTMTSRGYVTIYEPEHPRAWKSGYVLEHIAIWEQVHNEPLPEGWVVHHLNGIKNDNRPENLVALPLSKHNRQHETLDERRKQRIRGLEAKVKLLERTLDASQLIFHIGEN